MRKKVFLQRAFFILLVLIFFAGYAMYADAQALSDKIIRLHVIANSDTEEDQELKLAVRDRVLETVTAYLDGTGNRDEAEEIIKEHLQQIEEDAKTVVSGAGYDYAVSATIEVEKYPTREYETISLPAGQYLSLKIVIGEGEGKNWWCVIFPPVCISAATSQELAVMDFTSSEINLMTGEKKGYVIKFKILELFGELKNRLSR